MSEDPIRGHRRTEGAAWAIALLAVIISVPLFFVGMWWGLVPLIGGLVWACVVYYG